MTPGLPDRYRVLSTLGTGGGAVVYKALDTTLNRPVAIKALDPSAGAPATLRAEALAAASLDHPYICRVYELVDTPERTFIVIEFVEGETLAAKLQRGIPPLEATLAIGAEVAEGLQAAHDRGLVHRDIKPSNIMVTPHGHVKILDFGIAAAATPPSTEAAGERGRTWRAGSPAYMSPEQARGRDITPRSDLFSLGVVLYECLSGTLPFDGRTPYEYVSNLLTAKAVPLGTRAQDVPFPIVQLVDRCLDKDPRWRPESAAELARELQRQIEAGARGAATASLARWSSPRFRRRGLIAAGAAGLMAAAAAGWVWLSAPPAAIDMPRETTPLVTSPHAEFDSKLSPDGRWVSFLSDRDGPTRIWMRPLAGGDARALDLEGDVLAHIWSPDGTRIAGYTARGDAMSLQIVPAFFGGGPELQLPIAARVDGEARLLRWIGNNIYLTSSGRSQGRGQLLTRITLDDGSTEDVTPRVDLDIEWLDVDARGSLVVLAGVSGNQEDLWIADLGGARARRLTDDGPFDRFPMWTGSLVTFQSNRGGQIDLWQIDPDTLRLRALTSSEPAEFPESTTDDGRLITFHVAHESSRVWRTRPTGRAAPLTRDSLSDFVPTASPDGRTVAFQRQASTPALGSTLLDSQVFLARTNAAGAEVVSPSVTSGFYPLLSPGGTELAYFTRPTSGSRFASLFVKDLDTAEVRLVSAQCALPGLSLYPLDWVHQSMAWSVDRFLYFIEQSVEGSLIRRFDPRDGTLGNVTGVLKSFVTEVYPSPDGTQLAYLLYHDRSFQARVRDLATGTDRIAAVWPNRGAADVQLRGWTPSGALVAVHRYFRPRVERPALDILIVDRTGTRTRARIDDAYGETARLSTDGTALYFTASVDGVHNIYSLALAGGTPRRVTTNDLPELMFSGIEPLADGTVIYAVNERRQDIWLSRSTGLQPQGAQ